MAKPNVFVIPGFTGTTLYSLDRAGKRTDRWISVKELAVNGPNNFQLASDGVSPGPLASVALLPGSMVDAGVYEPLVTQLANDGWNVYFWGYDWRLSVLVNAPKLLGYLEENLSGQNFWVVAHSQGALLARVTYHQMQSAGLAAGWQRTVYLGGSNGGTYNAPAALANLDPPGGILGLFLNVLTGGLQNVRDYLFGRMGLNQRWQAVVASWPGLYELIPSVSGSYSALDPKAPAYFKIGTYAVWNPEVTQPLLASAAAAVDGFANLLAQPRPRETVVLGTGQVTDTWPTAPSDVGSNRGYTNTTAGDGVVPVDRQAMPGADSVTVTCAHQQLPGNGQVLAGITGWLENGSATPTTIPPPATLPTWPGDGIKPPTIFIANDPVLQRKITDP